MKLFIGFDIHTGNMEIMHAEKPSDEAAVDYLQFKSRIFTDEYFEEGRTLLEAYFAEHPTLQNLQAYVVLPNQSVGFETFNLPNMSRQKMQTALETELAYLYEGRQKNNKINTFTLCQNKQYTTIGAIYFDKKLIASVYKLLTDVKVFPKITTYSGNALLNCVYTFSPKTRGKSFVFADVHNEYTEIAVSSKGKTLGVAVIPHGMSIVKSPKVELEYMRTNHDVGELAVINAREAAKAKALTVTGDPSSIPADATIEDYAVTPEPVADEKNAVENADYNPDVEVPINIEVAADEAEAELPADEAQTAESSAGDKTDEFYESEEEENKRLEEEAKVKLKKIKVFKKMPKRYPKFMLRETPTTEEGIQFENWRIIAKWILLYARSAKLSEYTDSPDFVLVNMPEDHYFLLDMMNAEQGEKELQFRPFDAADKMSGTIKGNLNLYGGMFANHYNKNHNF